MRIANEICIETQNKLKDINLLKKYKKCESVKNKIKQFKKILKKYLVTKLQIESIINDYILELIPAGTKGVIRGNMFNKIVKKNIKNMNLDKKRFDVSFEKYCKILNTSETPDWYILDKHTNKVIIGMNQLDLWNGGQQLNRGSKYLINNITNTDNSKLLCVICNEIQFRNNKSKVYKLFDIGFSNNTLCYLKNLKNIINKYFSLSILY